MRALIITVSLYNVMYTGLPVPLFTDLYPEFQIQTSITRICRNTRQIWHDIFAFLFFIYFFNFLSNICSSCTLSWIWCCISSRSDWDVLCVLLASCRRQHNTNCQLPFLASENRLSSPVALWHCEVGTSSMCVYLRLLRTCSQSHTQNVTRSKFQKARFVIIWWCCIKSLF